jgi:hypothetical protein
LCGARQIPICFSAAHGFGRRLKSREMIQGGERDSGVPTAAPLFESPKRVTMCGGWC